MVNVVPDCSNKWYLLSFLSTTTFNVRYLKTTELGGCAISEVGLSFLLTHKFFSGC